LHIVHISVCELSLGSTHHAEMKLLIHTLNLLVISKYSTCKTFQKPANWHPPSLMKNLSTNVQVTGLERFPTECNKKREKLFLLRWAQQWKTDITQKNRTIPPELNFL
jgi:hypothetical protein